MARCARHKLISGAVLSASVIFSFGCTSRAKTTGGGAGQPPSTNSTGTFTDLIVQSLTPMSCVSADASHKLVSSPCAGSTSVTVTGEGTLPVGTDAGTPNAYVVTTIPPVSLKVGTTINFLVSQANTAPSTIDVSGTGVFNLTDALGHPFTFGELIPGVIYQAIFDGKEWAVAGSASGAAAPPGNTANLTGAIALGSLSGGSLNLYSIPMTNEQNYRGMLNFYCVGTGNGCSEGANSRYSMGFDGDNVFIMGGAVPYTAFVGAVENFDHWAWVQNVSRGGNDLVVDPSITKTSGDGICFGNSGSKCADPLFEIDSVTGRPGGASANCTSTTNPALCDMKWFGSVVIIPGQTSVVVNTSAIGDTSIVVATRDDSLNAKLGIPACNSRPSVILGAPRISARAEGSFTVTIDAPPTASPMCIGYVIHGN